VVSGLSRFTRRTINRAVTCCFLGLEVKAVNVVSATSASLTNSPVSSSTNAFG
jgi:hypothetical protein